MKIHYLLFLLPLLLHVSSASGQAMKRANKQYDLGAYSEAIATYKDYLNKNPNDLEANGKIADSYRHLNLQEKALPHYQAVVAGENAEDVYVFQYGLTLQELGRYEVAKAVFNKLAQKSGDYQIRAKQYADACQFALENTDPALYKVSNEFANTPLADFGPALFNDQVVFSSFRTDIKSRDARNAPSDDAGANRLFISHRDRNGFLEVPVLLHDGFGAGINDGPVAYTQDGKWVAFTRNNFRSGPRFMPRGDMEMTMFTAQADANGDWTAATAFPHNGTGFSNGAPSFSPDGKALFFASNQVGGYGGFDLYVSYRTGDSWSSPENLGSTVNSTGNEITPFYDGNTLYFASDYHKGYGGYDIFRSEETGGKWGVIYHGGPGLNSSTDDYGFVYDTNRNMGYMVSNRPGGKGGEDIYRVKKETESVVFKVTDALTGAAIAGAVIDFSACGEPKYETGSNGIFNFQLTDNLDCSVSVSKEGFRAESVRVTTIGLRQNKTVVIQLTNNSNAYGGRVIQATGRIVLPDVKVMAVNQKNNEMTIAETNSLGEYSIALLPNVNYVMRFSKAGYQELSATFNTAAMGSSKVLQDMELVPVGVAAPEKTQNTSITTAPDANTAASKEAAVTPAESRQAGFSVQLASASAVQVDLSGYSTKLGSLGSVYSVKESGKTKIRLGVFDSRDAAAVAQQKAKAAGYTGAFIVVEKASGTAPATTSTAKQATVTPPATVASETAKYEAPKGYLVRLGTYRDVKNFNTGIVDDIGVIKYVPKGDLTVVVLSGYESKSSAQASLQKAKNRGFPDAYLVMMNGTEIKKAE